MLKHTVMFFRLIIVAGCCLLVIIGCSKGDFEERERYMKFKLDAFYTDTSLFYSVKLDDTTLHESSAIEANRYFTMINTTTGIIRADSTRLKITVVKKNAPNINFDSVIYLTNINDFFLIQLDPRTPPALINKRLENATAKQPGKDSVKVRFFYNTTDNIRLANNRLADSVNLQLYTTEKVTDGEYKAPKKYLLIKGIRLNTLSSYLSLYGASNSPIKYGFELLDAKAPNAILQKYTWNSEDGFIKGVLDYYGDGKFRTLRINKSTKEGEWTFTTATGFNADYIFGSE